MERKRAYIFVIVAAAAFVLLFVALMYNAASLQKQNINTANQVSDATARLAAKEDLMIYWIGDLPPELSGLANVVTVIPPEQISEENMPIKYSTFKITEYDENGDLKQEIIPRDYKENMIIILYNVTMLPDEQKEVILNCVAQNGVPVLAIGKSSISLIRETLMYTAGSFEENDSFYYKLDDGYKDHVLDNAAIASGGSEFAINLTDYLYGMFYSEEPESETETSQMELAPEVW
jgi:hypothetical protein